MNDDHVCNIAAAVQSVLEQVDGLAKVDFEAFDVQNPPEDYQANIQLLHDTNSPLEGATEYDGFDEPRKLPAVDLLERGIMIDLVKRGTNWFGIQNLAARCYSALAQSEEVHALVDSWAYDGSIPSHSDPEATPFVSVALVFVFKYSTEAGVPGRRIHS